MDIYSDPTPIATVEQFKSALFAVRDRGELNDTYLNLLKVHCRAPNHTMSTESLAVAAGLKNFRAANMHYGKLANHVADALKVVLPPTPSGDPHWWRSLAIGKDSELEIDDDRYQWIMRPELVQALQELKWA